MLKSSIVFLAILVIIGSVVSNNAIYSVKLPEDSPQMIALTFDDGPHGTLTPKLLDILKEKKASATFFIMGVKVAKHKSIIERAITEGHEIANHVWNHPVLTKISKEAVFDQLFRTNMAIKEILGLEPKTMRPPYGNTNGKLNAFIQEKGNLSVIMWSLDTLDWKKPPPQQIVDFTVKKVKTGDIILCHDIHPGTIEVPTSNCMIVQSLSLSLPLYLSLFHSLSLSLSPFLSLPLYLSLTHSIYFSLILPIKATTAYLMPPLLLM